MANFKVLDSDSTDDSDSNSTALTNGWEWIAEHELPRWGVGSGDLAALHLPPTLKYPTLVTPELK